MEFWRDWAFKVRAHDQVCRLQSLRDQCVSGRFTSALGDGVKRALHDIALCSTGRDLDIHDRSKVS